MKKVLILGAAAIVTLAACSGGSKAASTTQAPTTQAPATTAPAPATTAAPAAPITTTVAPTTTVPPTTTTVDPMETARTAYEGLSSVNFTAKDIFNKYSPLSSTNIRAYCAEVAPLDEQFANSVRDGSWPASVQAAADAEAKAYAGVAGQEYTCASAATGAAAVATYSAIPFNQASDAASAMRLALGLTLNR